MRFECEVILAREPRHRGRNVHFAEAQQLQLAGKFGALDAQGRVFFDNAREHLRDLRFVEAFFRLDRDREQRLGKRRDRPGCARGDGHERVAGAHAFEARDRDDVAGRCRGQRLLLLAL